MNIVRNQHKKTLKKTFLVHGETKSMTALANSISEEGYEVIIPEKGEPFELWLNN